MSITNAQYTDEQRNRLWNDFVEKVVRVILPGQYEFAQSMGMVDLELRIKEQTLPLNCPLGDPNEVQRVFHEHQMLCVYSALWVLGAYELVRVIEKRLNPNNQNPPFPAARELKRHFERVRMPLAKQEKAKRASEPGDSGVALPQLSGRGCEWLLGEETISRRELADALLRFQPDLAQFTATP